MNGYYWLLSDDGQHQSIVRVYDKDINGEPTPLGFEEHGSEVPVERGEDGVWRYVCWGGRDFPHQPFQLIGPLKP